jgi:hypothetical protein
MSLKPEAPRPRGTTDTVTLASASAIVGAGLLTSLAWSSVSDTPIAVFSALVQTGVPTRLVMLGLLCGCGAALFALRTRNQIWFGRAVSAAAVALAWDMLRRLAIQIQAADVIGLAMALYLLVRGLVDVQEGLSRRSAEREGGP